MIINKIKSLLLQARKSNSIIEKNILSVVLGEIELKSAMKSISDNEIYNIINGIIKSNNSVIENLEDTSSHKMTLNQENIILNSLLPTYLSKSEIFNHLQTIDILGAKNNGIAMGLAVKLFKDKNLPVNNSDVFSVVEQIRGS